MGRTNPNFDRRLQAAIDAGLTAAAEVLESEIRRGFGVDHGGVPSRPGDFPNSQTGDLRNSIGHTKGESGVAFVGTNLPYGRYLQTGTSKMLPRPWATLGVMRAAGTMERAFADRAVKEFTQ